MIIDALGHGTAIRPSRSTLAAVFLLIGSGSTDRQLIGAVHPIVRRMSITILQYDDKYASDCGAPHLSYSLHEALGNILAFGGDITAVKVSLRIKSTNSRSLPTDRRIRPMACG